MKRQAFRCVGLMRGLALLVTLLFLLALASAVVASRSPDGQAIGPQMLREEAGMVVPGSAGDLARALSLEPIVPVTSGEDPALVRLADGTLWVVSNRWGRTAAGVWQDDLYYNTSSDGGATWSADTRFTTDTADGSAADVTQTEDGVLWVVWQSSRSGNSDIWTRSSGDGGVSWSADVQLTTDTRDDVAPALAVAGGRLWVLWEREHAIWFRVSIDGGVTWAQEAVLVTYASAPAIFQALDGTLWVLWSHYGIGRCTSGDCSAQYFSLWAKTSGDGGLTWSEPRQLPPVDFQASAYSPVMTQAADGTLWLVWRQGPGYYTGVCNSGDIYYQTSSDGGQSWSPAQFWNRFAGEDSSPHAARLGDGSVGLVWSSDRGFVDWVVWFGIPGVREEPNPPPAVCSFRDWQSQGDLRVEVTVNHYTELGTIDLVWSQDGVAQPDAAMLPGTESEKYGTRVGPFTPGTVLRYQVRVVDTQGSTMLCPSTPRSLTIAPFMTPTPTPSPTRTPTPNPTYEPIVQFGSATDPALLRLTDGSLWVVAVASGELWLHTSDDEGETWSAAVRLTTAPGDDDSPDLTRAGDGSVWLVWESARSGSAAIWGKSSGDGGTSWSTETQLTTGAGGDHYPAILQTTDRMWLVWQRDAAVWFRTTSDGGVSWTEEAVLVPHGFEPTIFQAADRTLWVLWRYMGNYSNCDAVWGKTSNDDGATWTTARQLTHVCWKSYDYMPAMAQAGDGTLWLMWRWNQFYSTCGDTLLYQTSEDKGVSWSPSREWFGRLSAGDSADLTQLSDGTIGVVWSSQRGLTFGIPGVRQSANWMPVCWASISQRPNSGEVSVEVRVEDPDAVQSVSLIWSRDGMPQPDLDVPWLSGVGSFWAEVGTFQSGTVIGYQLLLNGKDGQTVLDPDSPASFTVQPFNTPTPLPTRTPRPTPTPRTFEPTVHVTSGQDPALLQLADGRLWVVTTRGADDLRPDLWYNISSDGGATWSADVQLTTDPGEDLAPDIAQGVDGKMWVVWETTRSGTRQIWLKSSSDDGVAWSAETPLADGRHPAMLYAKDKLWVVWESQDGIWFGNSTDGGATWRGPWRVCDGHNPDIFQAADGRLWLIADESDKLVIRYNYDGGDSFPGSTWLADPRWILANRDPALAQSVDGMLWMMYIHQWGYGNCGSAIQYRTSSDNGSLWSQAVRGWDGYLGAKDDLDLAQLSGVGFGIVWSSERGTMFGIPGIRDEPDPPPVICIFRVWQNPGTAHVAVEAEVYHTKRITSVSLVWSKDGQRQIDADLDQPTWWLPYTALYQDSLGSFTPGTLIQYQLRVESDDGSMWLYPSVPSSLTVLPFETPTPTPTPTATPIPGGVVTLQQGSDGYTGSQDTYIYQWTPDTNYCTADLLQVGCHQQYVGILRFDVTSVPASAVVTHAALQVYSQGWDGENDIGIDAHYITRTVDLCQATWNEAQTGVNWGSPGGNDTVTDRRAAPEDSIMTTGNHQWYSFDLTAVVQDWIDGTLANNGVLLRSPEYPYMGPFYFASAENSEASLRPKLVITYYLAPAPTPTATPTATQTLIPTPTATPTATQTLTPTPTATPPSTVLRFHPGSTAVYSCTGAFTVELQAQDITALGGFSITFAFDPKVVHVQGIALGSLITSGARPFTLEQQIDNTLGQASLDAVSSGSLPGPSGSGPVAVITFSPVHTGTTSLSLQEVQLTNTGGVSFPAASDDGSATVLPALYGDLDCDCDVDIMDVMSVASHWATALGNPRYDSRYDLDSDGDIDIVDIMLIAAHWGEICHGAAL